MTATTRCGSRFSMTIIVAALIWVLHAGAAARPAPLEVTTAQAPETFAVRFETTKGAFLVEAYRSWAPHAVDRFYNLVRSGYFDGNVFYHVNLGNGVEFGINGDPKASKAWSASAVPSDPPRRKIRAGDVHLIRDAFGGGPSTLVRIQTGTDGSEASRTGATPLGRVVEGIEVLDSLDYTHMRNPRKAFKLTRRLWKEGDAKIHKEYPQLDSITSAEVIERAVETPAGELQAGKRPAANIPTGMAMLRVYRNDTVGQNFTLRIDGAPRAVLKPGTFFETTLPAGQHDLATKVKFKMFATGILDKAFAGGEKNVEEFEPGVAHYFRAVPIGLDGRSLRLLRIASDFGAEECDGLRPAKPIEGADQEPGGEED